MSRRVLVHGYHPCAATSRHACQIELFLTHGFGQSRNAHPTSFAMGEAAGTAAALAVDAQIHVRKVSIPDLQTALVRNGAYLGEIHAASLAR